MGPNWLLPVSRNDARSTQTRRSAEAAATVGLGLVGGAALIGGLGWYASQRSNNKGNTGIRATDLRAGSDLYTEEPARVPEPAKVDLVSDETIVPAKVALVSDETIMPANVDLVSDETTVPVVPLYSDPQRDIVHVASEISAPSRASSSEQEEPVPQEEAETQRNKVPQRERPANVYKEESFSIVPKKAGSGGSKVVYYIDHTGGDWVLALPNERGAFETYWPRMVREELHLSEQLQALGIPCLEMYGVMSKNLAEAGGWPSPALRMRSFDYYRRTYNSVIMEAKPNNSSFAPSTMDDAIIASVYRSAGPVGEVAWVARVAGALIALLTPLARDIKLLAEQCIGLGTDSLSWQVVFQDDTLDVPLEIRIFLFDLTSKWRETESILAERQTAAEKARKESAYLDSYFGDIYPFVGDAKYTTPEYREIKRLVRHGMSAVALSSAP